MYPIFIFIRPLSLSFFLFLFYFFFFFCANVRMAKKNATIAFERERRKGEYVSDSEVCPVSETTRVPFLNHT